MTPSRRQELLSFVYGQEVQRLAGAKGAREAWGFVGSLPAEIQALPALGKARQVFGYNWSVEVHNRFAQLWNAGNKDEALKLLRATLTELPDSALLKRDAVLASGN